MSHNNISNTGTWKGRGAIFNHNAMTQLLFIYSSFFFFLLVGLEFELRDSHLQSRISTT
jgi:hypothetical protein